MNYWIQKWRSQWTGFLLRRRTRPNHFIRTHRLSNIVYIDKPLVLISQLQRSGGMMLGGLLDNHAEIYAHPQELWIGKRKQFWPELDLNASPKEWFLSLRENRVLAQASTGLIKKGRPERVPFLFSQVLQGEIFRKIAAQRGPRTQREILNCYITSYFNAWIDYQGLYRDPAKVKYWSAFAARLAATPDQPRAFFRDYPDGYLISIIRDPQSWFASASRHSKDEYGSLDAAIDLWFGATQAILDNVRQFGDRVILINFEDLIRDTEGTMRKICQRIGIAFDPTLTSATFNGWAAPANSSFERGETGVIMRSTLDRSRELTDEQRRRISERVGSLYRGALELIGR